MVFAAQVQNWKVMDDAEEEHKVAQSPDVDRAEILAFCSLHLAAARHLH